MESPPKRITRARAAAKASEPAVKPTKIITPAAKAKSKPAATASTRSTAAKRKTRADESDAEDDDEDEMAAAELTAPKATRGRPRKTAEPAKETSTATRATRGRPAKKLATEASKQAAAAPARATRGRPRKVTETEPAAEAPKKTTTRGRAGTTSKATAATASTTAKSGVKKSVKFAEPGDKENIQPATKTATKKEAPTAGMNGRPARRGGATASRSTRKTTKSSDDGAKKPLSPKKVTQMPMQRDDESEDELAGPSQPPPKPMKKSPVKPPSSVVPKAMQPEAAAEEHDEDATTTVNMDILNPPTALNSPAKRPPASAFKDSMRSPARKIGVMSFPTSTFKSASKPSAGESNTSPSKNALLLSAAKRPPSPIKGLSFASPSKASPSKGQTSPNKSTSMLHSPAKRAMPGVKPLQNSRLFETVQEISETPAMKPPVMSTPAPEEASPSAKLLSEPQLKLEQAKDMDEDEDEEEEPFKEPIRKIQFPGRLSAVMPRDTDPSFSELEVDAEEDPENEMLPVQMDQDANELVVEAEPERQAEEEEALSEQQADGNELTGTREDHEPEAASIDAEGGLVLDEITVAPASSSPAPSEKSVPADPNYQLREKDLNPYEDMDVDSDSELHSPAKPVNGTPSGRMSIAANAAGRRSTIGFTSLAEQFGSWETASPDPLGTNNNESEAQAAYVGQPSPSAVNPTPKSTPSTSHFFEDEMEPHVDGAEGVIFSDDVMLEKEDLDLAEEADKMSEMMSEAGDEPAHQSFGDAVSDASQKYGDENDENQVPIDPAILGAPAEPIVTPIRPEQQRTFNTTTKVPLKPADNSTPSPLKKRSFSVSRLPPRRSGGLTNSMSAPSLSPTKDSRSNRSSRRSSIAPSPSRLSLTTPTKTSVDPILETPGRVRPEVNPALLRGAVVFVDVHTTEGADASSIFVELLTQMGARCRKTWDWTPSNESSGDSSSNKVGITHVVYKDGGKRTLKKVGQTQGLVQCVGVSWVLDCERENQWMDESPYLIDTSNVPRGGGRRRKSMEPKALSNMNGTLVSSPSKGGSSRDIPRTPLNRRDSTAWMRTPSDQGEGDQDDIEWSQFILTPVPKTPAPEAIAKYAADICDTPDDDEDTTALSSVKESLMMRTCPPKAHPMFEVGDGLLNRNADDQVMKRLLAARRKSMQFAPKIASPLSKTWK